MARGCGRVHLGQPSEHGGGEWLVKSIIHVPHKCACRLEDLRTLTHGQQHNQHDYHERNRVSGYKVQNRPNASASCAHLSLSDVQIIECLAYLCELNLRRHADCIVRLPLCMAYIWRWCAATHLQLQLALK